jgi:hypothetical protein
MEQKKDHPKNSPIKRREFFKLCGSVVAGGTILAVAGGWKERRLVYSGKSIRMYVRNADVARHIACYLSRP